jgi:hypothetical protein
MPLSARKVETARPGRHSDGHGLLLLVKPSGARSWVLRYQIDGRRRDMGLRSWPEITLSLARDLALDARRSIALGRDPLNEKAKRKKLLFRDAAATLIESKRSGWRNAKHAAQWTATLEHYAYPLLGSYDVRAITTENVIAVLSSIWTEKPETPVGFGSASRQASIMQVQSERGRTQIPRGGAGISTISWPDLRKSDPLSTILHSTGERCPI